MNADETRKASAFMYYDVKTKDQPALPDCYIEDMAGRMSKDRCVITFLGDMAKEVFDETDSMVQDYQLYDSEDDLRRSQQPIKDHDNMQRVALNRELLMKLLAPMTSDYVILKIADDYPIKICGEIGDQYAAAYIAPRIDE